MDDDFYKKVKLFTQLGVTSFILGLCLWIHVADAPGDNKKWAMGMIGVVVGYWLK